MRKWKKILFNIFLGLSIIISSFSFLSLADIAFAQETKAKTIRVAFPTVGALSYRDEFGSRRGYSYEYLQEIAQYTGWEYEFVELPGNSGDTFSTMLGMLKNGEIDLMGGMLRDDSTMKLFDFPEYQYGYRYNVFLSAESNLNITENNFITKKEHKIAVVKSETLANAKTEDFCKLSNINYELVECENLAAVHKAIENGTADVMVGTDLEPLPGTKVVRKFDGRPFYFATTKGNSDIINQLNSALLTISQVKPLFESTLYAKYFSNKSKNIYFSDVELDYAKNAKPIKLAFITSLTPMQYEDRHGDLRGINKDILSIISKKSGLAFEFVKAESYIAAFKLLKKGEVDAVTGIPYDYDLAGRHGLIMSTSFISSPMVLVSPQGKSDSYSGKVIGIIENIMAPELANQSHTVAYTDYKSCLDAVMSGDVDFAYINMYSAEYFSRYSKYREARIIPQAGKSLEFCLGVSKQSDNRLVSIVNKVISSLSESDFQTIIFENTTGMQQQIGFFEIIMQNPIIIIIFFAVLFGLFLAFGLFILHHKVKQSRMLGIENQRYLQLCELANEYIYEFDVRNDVLMFSTSFSKLFNLPMKLKNYSAITSGRQKPNKNFPQFVYNRLPMDISKSDSEEREYFCTLPSGEKRWFKDKHVKIDDPSGAVIYYIGKLVDVQSEHEERERLELSALTDGMTGLYNIAAFKSEVTKKLKAAPKNAALILIDIDNFKTVNDELGHYIGDLALKDFSECIKQFIGEDDISGRLGGDEFVVFISSANGCEAVSKICSTLCQRARQEYSNDQGISCGITISIGAVISSGKSDYETLYKRADIELYNAKRKGRNGYSIADC